jgi:hypothetical protein
MAAPNALLNANTEDPSVERGLQAARRAATLTAAMVATRRVPSVSNPTQSIPQGPVGASDV